MPLVDSNFAAVSAEPLAMAFIFGNSAKWNIRLKLNRLPINRFAFRSFFLFFSFLFFSLEEKGIISNPKSSDHYTV